MKSSKYQKKIYLLGDLHVSFGLCIDEPRMIHIIDWLKSAMNTPVFIDLFFEYGREYSHGSQGSLTDSYRAFEHCIPEQHVQHTFPYKGPRKCTYPNVRVHYGDFRNAPRLAQRIKKGEIKINEQNIVSYFDQIVKEKIIQKELSKMVDPDLVPKLIKHYRQKTSKITKSFVDNLLGHIMDVYLIARIFKKFDVTKGPVLHPSTANNCIVFIGRRHVGQITEFLKSLDFEMIDYENKTISQLVQDESGGFLISQNKEFKCLDIRNMTLPLFQ
jgi:hypothetical protein